MNVFELMATLSLDSRGYDQGLDEAEGKAGGFGDRLKSGLANAAKVGVGAIVGVGAAATALGAGFVKQTGNVAAYGDNIDKMSQKMGMSAEAYQEWDAVMRHSGTSMEAMKASMKTLANAAETGSDAFQKLGISQEQLASMSQEELFEATISALQNVEDETERTYLAGKTLGRGATELGALLNTSAEDTQAMRDKVHELGGVMSDDAVKAAAAYQDSLQDMQTAISGATRGIVSEFLPSVTTVMDGIAAIFGGDGDAGVEMITQGIDAMLATMDEAVPRVMEVGGKILESISTAVLNNLPQIAERGADIIANLITGVVSNLPQIISVAFRVIVALAKGIIKNFPKIIDAGKNAISSLAKGIQNNLPQMARSALNVIARLAQGLISNAPRILAQGVQLMGRLASGIVQGIPTVVGKIPGLVSRIIRGFTSINWGSIGRNIISGIANGLKGAAGRIADAARNAASRALNAAKNFLGIESPSKVFRDQVGLMMAEGMAVGFERGVDRRDYEASINDLVDGLEDYDGYIDTGAVSVTTDTGMGQLLALLEAYLPGLANTQIVMSTGEVVGALAPAMNTEIGRLNLRQTRREGYR